MKHIIITLLAFTFSHSAHSQERVELCVDKLTQLIFHDNISSIRGGYDPTYFIQSHENNVLYMQPLDSIAPTNLYVVTSDKLHFVFSLSYSSSCDKFYHIIDPKSSVFRGDESSMTGDSALPYFGSKSDVSMLDKICSICLNRKERLPIITPVMDLKIYATLQNIYVDDKFLYFKISLRNSSSINYSIDYLTFYIENKKRKDTTTSGKEQLLPRYSTLGQSVVYKDKEATMIYVFDKFTINSEKLFCIDIIERAGERKISFKINSKVLLRAQNL